MKKKRKKAQVTIFVILGMVMLIMVFLILYAVSQVTQASEEQQARQAASRLLDSESVNYYVQTCLDVATTQAIDEIMLQGGVFYNYQNGSFNASTPGETHVPYNLSFGTFNKEINISYSIRANNTCPIIEYEPPHYPKSNTKLSDLYGEYQETFSCSLDNTNLKDHSGFFGLNNISRLCSFNSTNSKNIPGVGQSPCFHNYKKSSTADEPESIEKQLRERISLLLKNCIDFNDLYELQGTTIEPTGEDPEIDIILNKNSISVKATYPFTANVGDESTLIKHEFKYASPHRIVKLHNYVTSLLAADTKNILFNLSATQDQRDHNLFSNNTFPNVKKYYDSYFEIKILPINCDSFNCRSYEYDNILIVQDKLSYIQGRPLTLATVIQNRRPALDIIRETQPHVSYHIMVGVGEELIISPQGYNPDDQRLTYKYSGWKEDYTKVCEIRDRTFQCGENITLHEPILTNSQLFIETKRAVNYTTNATDVGLHTVTVTVYDEAGLYDYQNIKILVFDPPTTNTTTQSIYTNLPENVTSIEDPIEIRGSLNQTPQFSYEYINYTWKITNEIGIIYEDTIRSNSEQTQKITFPTGTPTAILLQEIKSLLFNVSGTYKVEFTAGIQFNDPNFDEYLESTSELDLEVKQCIPYRNNNNLIYPYNNPSPSNPFLANHTCCGGNIDNISSYELLASSTICYEKKYYGELSKLQEQALDELKNNSFNNYEAYTPQININTPSTSNENDVFSMTIQRHCDGKRGNICAGELIANIIIINTCKYDSNLLEQCEGPSIDVSTTNAICTKYTTMNINNPVTFETTYNKPDATGICNDEPECSNINIPNGNGYGILGPHLCEQAYCNNGECTKVFSENCECDQSCNAECYSGRDSYWTNNICKYGNCLPNSCTFQETNTTMCPQGTTFCYNETTNFCYSNVGCDSAGSQAIQGDYCKRNERYEAEIRTGPTTKTVNVCLHGTINEENACNNAGDCSYDETFFECSTGTPTCYAASEPKCCQAGTCQNPIKYTNPVVEKYIYPD